MPPESRSHRPDSAPAAPRPAGVAPAPDGSSPVEDVRPAVRERYAAIAGGRSESCCEQRAGCGCAGDESLARIGYTAVQAAAVPEGANLGLGCGNPLAHAGLRPGETVLDLGSGAGIDCFLAAREVGPQGRVIGVDMTPAMVERARANARHAGAVNVEFRLGEIEHLPVADASVDLVISNCVINLSPDKQAVFREAFRVLRPGGRLVVSDLVLTRPLPAEVRGAVDALVGCVAGASLEGDYLALIRAAGFRDVEPLERGAYGNAPPAPAGGSPGGEALDAVLSLKVRARKP